MKWIPFSIRQRNVVTASEVKPFLGVRALPERADGSFRPDAATEALAPQLRRMALMIFHFDGDDPVEMLEQPERQIDEPGNLIVQRQIFANPVNALPHL